MTSFRPYDPPSFLHNTFNFILETSNTVPYNWIMKFEEGKKELEYEPALIRPFKNQ